MEKDQDVKVEEVLEQTKRVLSAKDVMSAEDSRKEWVEVPEWGGGFYVKVMSGEERDLFDASTFMTNTDDPKQNFKHMRARLVAYTAVDENGKHIFNTKEKVDVRGNLYGDIVDLSKKSSIALDRVYRVASRINLMRKSDVDELVKNSL